ncbi:universal stress protein [Formosa haliotis]|uniref:universal stress protein n=1 Tax=Formosa haliotis TaxID=1555194 RepID=UPI0008240271|nr:universal stress protein [Formosa haliotis]
MRNILLPTDFSENAWNAIEYALKMFKDESCKFYVLHSYCQPTSGPYTGITSGMARESIYKAQVENSKDGLKEVFDQIHSNFENPNHEFVKLSVYDLFPSAVKKIVEDQKIDVIIMGTEGADGLKEITVGSNTAGLIGLVKCPIVAIPKNVTYKAINEIAFSTDYNLSFSKKGLAPLLEIAKVSDSFISVLHIMDRVKELTKSQKAKHEKLNTILKDYKSDYFTLTDIGVSSGVRAFVQSRKVDMLCVVTKEKDFLKRILNQSYSKSISNHSSVPLLILNAKSF